MARLSMLLVAMVLVSCSVASAARVLQEQSGDVYQEAKFKHGHHHDHAKPKLPSLPKPTLPAFTLPGCSPPPPVVDTPYTPATPETPYTPSTPETPVETPYTPSSPTYTPSPYYPSPSPPPPAVGY